MYPTTPHPGLSVHAAVPATRHDSHPAGAAGMDLVQLRRFQWAVRAALALGVAASVCANVLHARDNFIAQAIAAWPPLALMLTVELISRVPVYRRALAALRMLATVSIAGIAAYVSYFHMAAVVSRYGEHQPNPYLLPISVDGLIVVASVSLVELAGRVRAARDSQHPHHRAETPVAAAPPEDHDIEPAEVPTERARRNGHHPGVPPLTLLPEPPAAPARASVPEPAPAPISPSVTAADPSAASRAEPVAARLPGAPREPAPPPTPGTPPDADPDDNRDDNPTHDRDDRRNDSGDGNRDADADPDLAALLPAARAARDTLNRNGRSLTRDSLAAQLRGDGHTIRTSRVSALLNLIKNDEPATVNGRGTSSLG